MEALSLDGKKFEGAVDGVVVWVPKLQCAEKDAGVYEHKAFYNKPP